MADLYNALDPNQRNKAQQLGGQAQAPQQIDAPFPHPNLPQGPGQQIDDPNRPRPPIGGTVAPPAPAPAPAAPGGTAAGWEDVGYGNLVRNSATGQMVDRNHPIYTSALAAGSAAPAPAAPGAPAAGAPATPPATIADSFKSALINKLNPSAAPSLNDPALKAQSDAYAVGQTRATDSARRAMAERAAQEGGIGVNSGAFNQGLEGLFQKQGDNQAGFNAGLVGDAQKQQDADLMQALGLGGQSVGQDKSLALQDKLGGIDAQIRNRGIDSQAATAASDIALRGRLGDQSNNLGLLGMLMQNDQFGKQLGQNASQFGQSMDTNTILGLLGGL